MGNILPNYFECKCRPGYTGPFCEIQIDPCSSDPCLNFGICMTKPDGYECLCLPNFNGSRCENDYSAKNAVCECPTGYTGSFCETFINQCPYLVNPCKNFGICLGIPNEYLLYTCHCLPGTTGANCEILVDLCESAPCRYGSNCTMPDNFSYRCDW